MMVRWIRVWKHLCALGVLAVAILAIAVPARATTSFANGSFENVGSATASFSIDNPTGLPDWTATPSGNKILDCLIFVSDSTNLCGTVAFGGGMKFWVNPGASPDGGNFVGIDGSSSFSTPLDQTVTGLVVGQDYNVTFYQAAAQQYGFTGATTEQWQVSLGATSQLSTLMLNANHGDVGWMPQSMTFTSTATSEVLSFLALGTPSGEPPFVLLDGVALAPVPEPGTYVLMGFGGLGLVIARKLGKRRA